MDDQGIMILLIIACKFRFTFNLVEEEVAKVLAKVNKERENARCFSAIADKQLHRTIKNAKDENALILNPFCRNLELGKGREGLGERNLCYYSN